MEDTQQEETGKTEFIAHPDKKNVKQLRVTEHDKKRMRLAEEKRERKKARNLELAKKNPTSVG